MGAICIRLTHVVLINVLSPGLHGSAYKLIDLDSSAKIGIDRAGAKYSSGYSPPELALYIIADTVSGMLAVM